MSRLQVGVLLGAAPVPPPGIDAYAYRRALAGDVYDTVHNLASTEAALLCSEQDLGLARELAWPGAAVHVLDAIDGPAGLVASLGVLADRGAELAVVLSADAPDLPGMLVGKLFSALEDAPCSVCPADDGTLVGMGVAVPVPPWLRTAAVGLDTADAVARLHDAAPARGVVVGPGWHRVRRPGDVARLDPGLEGWESTRALLGG